MITIAVLCIAVLAFFSAMLIVPAGAAVLTENWQMLEAIAILGVAYGFTAIMAALALFPRLRRLNRVGLFRASMAMWLTLVIAAMPLFMLLEAQSPIAALFEAVSAAVTMGVTFRSSADIGWPMAIYRGMVAWQGGLLTLLLAVYVLGRSEVGGTMNRHLRFVLHGFQTRDLRIPQTFMEVFVPYASITLVAMAFLVLVRVPAADAFTIALALISTNGFLPIETGASVLNNIAGEIIMLLFMVIGATSILWHRALITRRWRQAAEQEESVLFIAAVLVMAILAAFAGAVTGAPTGGLFQSAFNKVFDVVSVMTTTGITHDQRVGLGLPFELILILALMGGCSYSTAGGIKAFRFGVMLRHSGNEIRRLVYPHAMLTDSVDSSVQEFTRAKAVWSASSLSIVAIVLATLVFSLQGIELENSLGLAIGTFSATGNLVTASLAVEGNGAPSLPLQAGMSLLALFGRIELLVVLAAFGRNDW